VPVVGVASSAALLAAVEDASAVLLPSGARDRLRVDRDGAPVVVHADDREPDGAVAVDLEGRASAAAIERGRAAVAGLPRSLLRIGAARLAAGDSDDPERLVPAYAVAPRGAPLADAEGGVAWSRDRR
jgi:hypothetical protein